MKTMTIAALMIIALAVCSVTLAVSAKQEAKSAAGKSVKQVAAGANMVDIPGITTPDKTPHACVDCHVNHPEKNMDYRLPSILAQWRKGADPRILAKAKAAAPEGRTLTGKHPDVAGQIKIIPDDCLKCHKRDAQMAPPFAKLLHTIHLAGGPENHFLTMAKGTCTSCHKLDLKTGAWHMGSGAAQ
jgi:hypothetical protein